MKAIAQKAWKIFLAEVGEEGLALIGDKEAKELTKRSFRLGEIFQEEEQRRIKLSKNDSQQDEDDEDDDHSEDNSAKKMTPNVKKASKKKKKPHRPENKDTALKDDKPLRQEEKVNDEATPIKDSSEDKPE